MSRAEGELPEFQVGRVMLTATELAGLAECEAAARCGGTLGVEDSQEMEDLPNSPTIFYVGKKPTRQRFVLRHGTKADTETGIRILTKMPHRQSVVRRRLQGKERLIRAPIISDEDRFEPSDTPGFEPPPAELFLVAKEPCMTKLADVLDPTLVAELFRQS